MAQSTGPILAVGAVTLTNQTIFNQQPINWRVPIGTGVAAVGLAMLERVSPALAIGIAWIALVTATFTRVADPKQPGPAENALKWWNG